MYEVLLDPTVGDAKSFLEKYVGKTLLTILAECEILYRGRAFSHASLSVRLTLIKPDGSVIIHEGTKREPINWQPPGSKIELSVEDRVLRVKAERKRPKEILEILMSRVFYITSAYVNEGNFVLMGSEKDEVDMVISKPELIEDGFIPIQREYTTPYGKVDLLGKDSQGNFLVLEFKRSKATLQAVSQLYRYVMYFKERGEKVRGILVAPGISENALNLLKRLGLEYVNLGNIITFTSSSRFINSLSGSSGSQTQVFGERKL
ncbi:endonuclease NucS [Stygiolobus caldivivus]|uniref:Endonuclease NucS n=1 Tax=Stygiolobus caldivivus TaxID=2824673 RepID=A0A8D5U555_9CREN|nr:endonuclease NucS [Stygiolobus caldivivus]BCU69447.1 endonuclease NucS [Stygiolobus caldivivus]